MEAINRTLTDMSNMFNQRMSEFEQDLKKTPCTSSSSTSTSTTSGLAAEFAAFRKFIVQTLDILQQQIGCLALSLDNMEMRGRRKILLLHGISEVKEEKTAQILAQVVKERFKLELTVPDIKRCHRMGRSTSHKPRPILFKLHDVALRDKIWFDKAKLKGSGITVSEFLTKSRHNVFMAARERFGVSQCWTREGTVFVLDSEGSRHRVTSFVDLNKIRHCPEQVTGQLEHINTHPDQILGLPEQGVVAQPVAVGKVASTKIKRAVARK